MERSLSQDIREEREELREAAEQTLNAIVDLNLDGTIKWVSPSWTDVVGTEFESVNGLPISDLIVSDNKSVFTDVVESMQKDDSRSHRVRFAIQLGPLSKLLFKQEVEVADPESENPRLQALDLEAQGIMVYDSVSGGESHVSLLHTCIGLTVIEMLMSPFLDHVDAAAVDRAPRDQNRPPHRHC